MKIINLFQLFNTNAIKLFSRVKIKSQNIPSVQLETSSSFVVVFFIQNKLIRVFVKAPRCDKCFNNLSATAQNQRLVICN